MITHEQSPGTGNRVGALLDNTPSYGSGGSISGGVASGKMPGALISLRAVFSENISSPSGIKTKFAFTCLSFVVFSKTSFFVDASDPLYRAAQKTLHRSVFFDGSILLLHHTKIGIR